MNIYGCQEDRRDCLSTDLVGCKRRERQGQRQAAAHGYRIVDEFYDAAVSGADPVAQRPGFKAMLDRVAGNGVRVILVESPDRFARDLSVQITGHDYLRSLGVELVPTSAPDFFTTDTPTAVLVRQVLGAVSQFEKANLSRSTTAGPLAIPTAFANTRRNWSRLHRTLSWPTAPRSWLRCNRRLPLFQSCLWGSPTLSVQAWSKAWRGRATIPPALSYSNTGLAGNGWSCSKR